MNLDTLSNYVNDDLLSMISQGNLVIRNAQEGLR